MVKVMKNTLYYIVLFIIFTTLKVFGQQEKSKEYFYYVEDKNYKIKIIYPHLDSLSVTFCNSKDSLIGYCAFNLNINKNMETSKYKLNMLTIVSEKTRKILYQKLSSGVKCKKIIITKNFINDLTLCVKKIKFEVIDDFKNEFVSESISFNFPFQIRCDVKAIIPDSNALK